MPGRPCRTSSSEVGRQGCGRSQGPPRHPLPVEVEAWPPWYRGDMDKGWEGGFLRLLCSLSLPSSKHLRPPPPVRGISPPLSLQAWARMKSSLACGPRKVLGPGPLSLLEASKASAAPGKGALEAQGPAWGGI